MNSQSSYNNLIVIGATVQVSYPFQPHPDQPYSYQPQSYPLYLYLAYRLQPYLPHLSYGLQQRPFDPLSPWYLSQGYPFTQDTQTQDSTVGNGSLVGYQLPDECNHPDCCANQRHAAVASGTLNSISQQSQGGIRSATEPSQPSFERSATQPLRKESGKDQSQGSHPTLQTLQTYTPEHEDGHMRPSAQTPPVPLTLSPKSKASIHRAPAGHTRTSPTVSQNAPSSLRPTVLYQTPYDPSGLEQILGREPLSALPGPVRSRTINDEQPHDSSDSRQNSSRLRNGIPTSREAGDNGWGESAPQDPWPLRLQQKPKNEHEADFIKLDVPSSHHNCAEGLEEEGMDQIRGCEEEARDERPALHAEDEDKGGGQHAQAVPRDQVLQEESLPKTVRVIPESNLIDGQQSDNLQHDRYHKSQDTNGHFHSHIPNDSATPKQETTASQPAKRLDFAQKNRRILLGPRFNIAEDHQTLQASTPAPLTKEETPPSHLGQLLNRINDRRRLQNRRLAFSIRKDSSRTQASTPPPPPPDPSFLPFSIPSPTNNRIAEFDALRKHWQLKTAPKNPRPYEKPRLEPPVGRIISSSEREEEEEVEDPRIRKIVLDEGIRMEQTAKETGKKVVEEMVGEKMKLKETTVKKIIGECTVVKAAGKAPDTTMAVLICQESKRRKNSQGKAMFGTAGKGTVKGTG
ncbi:MAG: hypothetical protein Q9184_005583 [Pyrenodesmia sp. 2 TL-2023]